MSSEGQSGRDPLVGAVLGGKYRVEALLARGGMGRVYRGVQQPLERPVAIKVLDFHALDQERNEQIEKRFFLEASVCAKLTHPNTLTIHDYGTIDGARGLYIVMEFLEGKSLRDLMKELRSLPVARALHIARQICGALVEAHEAGLVHRDLKPGNVVLVHRSGDPDFVKVVDFGLVKQVASRDDSAEILTAEGLFLGTPRYMAPEQITGDEVDARTDIYALGVMLYEALSGQPPFRSKIRGEVPVDLFNAHLKKRPPPLSQIELSARVPPDVEAIVMRCLEKEPRRRFASMRDLLAAIDAASRGLDEVATHIQPMAPEQAKRIVDTLLDEAPDEQATAATQELLPSGRADAAPLARWAAAFSAMLVLALISVVAWLSFTREPTPAVPVVAAGEAPAAPSVTAEPLERAQPPPATFALRVTSTPTGAAVTRGEKRLGVTPLEVVVERASLVDGETALLLSLQGYADEERQLLAPEEGPLEIDVTLTATKPAVPKKRPQVKRSKPPRRPPADDPELDIKVDR